MDFQERKKIRTKRFLDQEFGRKLRTCTACNGSGRYDHNNSPPCSSCDGTGKERGPKTKQGEL